MKAKTTLILLAMAAASGLYVKFYESKRSNTEEARRQAQNVVNFDREKVNGIVIQNGDDKTELRRQENKWRLEAPIKDQADSAVVESLLAALESWQKDSTISAKDLAAEKKTLDEFGLSKPKLHLKLLGPENSPEILFGKDAALEGKMYVRFADSKDAVVASQAVRSDAAKKPEEFRDWILSDDIRKARYRGRHYAPIIALWWMTADRRPTADFPQLMRKIEAGETRIIESDGIALTRPHPREIDGSQLVRPSARSEERRVGKECH